MVGLDLSAAMLRKLAEKSSGLPSFPVLRADATRLPFRDGVFGGAIARHVLHLIPRWQDAVAELVRVVRPGGVLLLNIGTEGGRWEELQRRLETAAGPGSGRVGLTAADHALLDETLRRLGPRFRALPPVWEQSDSTPARFFEEAEGRVFSWTWKVPADRLTAAIDTTRAWAEERFGSLDAVLEARYPMVWRAYDVPA
jgi:SAM-dependent methyltransferase